MSDNIVPKRQPSAQVALDEAVQEALGLTVAEAKDIIDFAEDGAVEGKPAANLVLAILGGITAACIGAMAYELVVTGSDAALQVMSSIGLIGVGALAGLLGQQSSSAD